jgi:predicted  nucleic acid-binding Zn-ribbon protein
LSEASDLLELQSVDLDILRASKRLDELPEKRAILEARAKSREAAALKQKAELLLRKLESEVKARQDELTTLNEKIASEQEKLMNTSDHRAVQAISREMDGFKRRVDKVEMEELQFMERAEKAKSQVEAISVHMAKLAERESQLIERFKQVGGGIQNEIAQAEGRRDKLVTGIDPALLSRYDALRESKGGIAVGMLEESGCSACRMTLPIERRAELESGPDVGICPQCRRLIVVRRDAE